MRSAIVIFLLSYCIVVEAQQQSYPSLFTATYSVDTLAKPDYYKFYVTITSYWVKTDKSRRGKYKEVDIDSMRNILIQTLKQNNVFVDSLKLCFVDNRNTNTYQYNTKLFETYSFTLPTKDEVLKVNNILTMDGISKKAAYPKLNKSLPVLKSILLKKAYALAEQRAIEYSKEKNVTLGKIYTVNEMIYYQDSESYQSYHMITQKTYLGIAPNPVTLSLMVSYEMK